MVGIKAAELVIRPGLGSRHCRYWPDFQHVSRSRCLTVALVKLPIGITSLSISISIITSITQYIKIVYLLS